MVTPERAERGEKIRVSRQMMERIDRKVPVALLAQRAGVRLRNAGREIVGECLLHEASGEATLKILRDVNLWSCEACCAGGSAIAWVMHHSNLGRQQAALMLLDEFFPGQAAALRQGAIDE